MKRWHLLGLAWLALLGVGYWLFRPEPAPRITRTPWADAPEGRQAMTIQTEPMPIAQLMAGKTGIVEMVLTERGIEPSELRTTIGSRVKIHVRNAGEREHNLVIPRWGIVPSANLPPGGETYIEFTAGEKGAWEYFSDAPGEVEPALKGILKVE